MSYLDIVTAQLRLDEGERLQMYKDTVGKWSIGVGRNLTDVGISEDELELMLKNDVHHAAVVAATVFTFTDEISDNRKAALVNLAFNLGEKTLETFTTFISLVIERNWSAAADDLLTTKYAQQLPARSARVAAQLRNG